MKIESLAFTGVNNKFQGCLDDFLMVCFKALSQSYPNLCYNDARMSKHKVIIPVDLKPSPSRYEITAAGLLANHFKADVEFMPRSNLKTPDFIICGQKWELKSPTGIGKNNIERQLQTGLKQSRNIIFDARRSKIHISKIRSELNRQYSLTKSMKRLILIEKNKTVIEILK